MPGNSEQRERDCLLHIPEHPKQMGRCLEYLHGAQLHDAHDTVSSRKRRGLECIEEKQHARIVAWFDTSEGLVEVVGW